eukprot:347013-Rhodomonas_salina.1
MQYDAILCGNDLAYNAMLRVVLTYDMLLPCAVRYTGRGTCGTDLAYAATMPYEMCGTELAYAATMPYEMCGTELAYAATSASLQHRFPQPRHPDHPCQTS